MRILAAEVRVCLRDADLQALLENGSFEIWKTMAEGVAEEWHGDLAERVALAASAIAGNAARRWPEALKALLEREAIRAGGYADLRRVHADTWRRRLEAFRVERARAELESRHVMDGVLVSAVLAEAMREELEGTSPAPKLERRDAPDEAYALAAAFFGTRRRSAGARGAPVAKGLAKLASVIAQLRWADRTRAEALAQDGVRLATRAGQVALGVTGRHPHIEAESREDGALVLMDGRNLVHIDAVTLSSIAPMVPRAAAARLREIAPEDDGHALLAEALLSVPARRATVSILGVPSSATPTAVLRHQARLYEAVPQGPRPHALSASGKLGRETRAVAMADGTGAHVGYAAFDALSRELHGRSLRAVYDLDGQRRGRLQEDEGGWRFLEGEPVGGFRTAPAEIALT